MLRARCCCCPLERQAAPLPQLGCAGRLRALRCGAVRLPLLLLRRRRRRQCCIHVLARCCCRCYIRHHGDHCAAGISRLPCDAHTVLQALRKFTHAEPGAEHARLVWCMLIGASSAGRQLAAEGACGAAGGRAGHALQRLVLPVLHKLQRLRLQSETCAGQHGRDRSGGVCVSMQHATSKQCAKRAALLALHGNASLVAVCSHITRSRGSSPCACAAAAPAVTRTR
jgi:hypothetical protein